MPTTASIQTRRVRFQSYGEPAVRKEFAGLAAEGRFSIPIARTFRLDEWKTALSVSEGQQARGKLILLP